MGLVLFQFLNLLGLNLLLDLQHLQLSLGLSSLELMLPLQTGKISFCCGLASSSLFGLLNGLGSQELLFFLFSFKFLSGFFGLKPLELLSAFLGENLLLLTFLLCLGDFGFQIKILLELLLACLLFCLELLQKLLLFLVLLHFEIKQGFGLSLLLIQVLSAGSVRI